MSAEKIEMLVKEAFFRGLECGMDAVDRDDRPRDELWECVRVDLIKGGAGLSVIISEMSADVLESAAIQIPSTGSQSYEERFLYRLAADMRHK